MKRQVRIYFILSLFLVIGLFSCKKQNLNINCCTGELLITTEKYNSDSLMIASPNAFTPNGDGLNDKFQLILVGILKESFDFRIYIGQRSVYQTQYVGRGWDGVFNDKITEGIYRYEVDMLTYHGDYIHAQGEVCLILSKPEKVFRNCGDCLYGHIIGPTGPIAGFPKEITDGCE